MRILIINGPNLNLLGRREPAIYGTVTFGDYLVELQARFPDITFEYRQSNVEGELINFIQDAELNHDGVILNAGGYTHTSVSIADAISSIGKPVVEVHISNVTAREDFRHVSLIAPFCRGTISGFGLDSYRLAVESFLG